MIGVGALSLPKAFSQAGLVLGALLLFILASVSYVTATYMVEAMAIANAYMKYKFRKKIITHVQGAPNVQTYLEVNYYCNNYLLCIKVITPDARFILGLGIGLGGGGGGGVEA